MSGAVGQRHAFASGKGFEGVGRNEVLAVTQAGRTFSSGPAATGSKPNRLRRQGLWPWAAGVGRILFATTVVLADVLRAATLPSYYAHAVVQDSNGVIAPWYPGLNGQLDERINIAVNVYKRYP